MAGNGFAGIRTRPTAFHQFADPFGFMPSAPHFDERPDDGAHHISQESVGFYAENEQIVLFKPICLHDAAVICLHLSVKLRKTRKVLIFKENLSCFIHLRHIERTIYI